MRESVIETKVKEHAEGLGFLVYKFVSPGRRGVPDKLFVSPSGVVFFIEFKQLGKKPEPCQVREIKYLRDNNAYVFTVDKIDYGKGIIDGFIE